MSLDNMTQIVWPWEHELGVKNIFSGICVYVCVCVIKMLYSMCFIIYL